MGYGVSKRQNRINTLTFLMCKEELYLAFWIIIFIEINSGKIDF